MVIALRIILGFIATLVFMGITFFTFLSSPDYLSVPNFIEQNGSGGILGASHYDISRFDHVYSNTTFSDENYYSSGAVSIFDISKPGKYISSLRDTQKKYTFSGTGFTVQQEGIGELFFDSITTEGKVFIYAMNSPVTLSLINESTQEKYVDIHLNPHMYLEFQANRGKFLRNADRIRISTVFKLGYVGSIGGYGDDAVAKYISSEDEFFEKILSVIRKKDTYMQDFLFDFSSQEVSQIPWYDLIQRYVHLFVNDQKKIVFYQNKVLEGYLKILSVQKIDTSIVSQIRKDLHVLQGLDISGYETLLEIKDQITLAINANSREEYIIPKILLSTFENENFSLNSWYFPLYGFSLFTNYDITGNFSYTTSKKFLQSFGVFNEISNNEESQTGLKYDYFLYYLERQLLHLLQSSNARQDVPSIISTLENYINLSFQNTDYDTTVRVSRLFVFSEILGAVESFLRTNYFLLGRTEDGLLALNSENNIPIKEVQDFQRYVNTLYEIYEEDKKYLDTTNSRDAGIMKDISTFQEKTQEYFLALENYQGYQAQYDVSKNNLLSLDTFYQGEDNSLTNKKIQDYLSQFVGVTFRDASIIITDDIYYSVERLYISGKVFSFDIYPTADYKLTNIFIENERKPTQYKLGNIQEDWEERYKTASNEQKDQYDFSRFFLLTFFKGDSTQVEEYVNTSQTATEDKTEVVFKKDVLLGNPGEFKVLGNAFSIEYRDISLEKDDKNYKIFLDDVDFQAIISEGLGRNSIYRGVLKSEYVFNNVDHYFKTVSLKVYKKYDAIEDGFSFGGNEIHIGGKIHISDIKGILSHFMERVLFYDGVYTRIENISGTKNITLQYTSFNDKFSIKFDSGSKKYTILLHDGNIESIYQGIKKVASGNIAISDIQNYIK